MEFLVLKLIFTNFGWLQAMCTIIELIVKIETSEHQYSIKNHRSLCDGGSYKFLSLCHLKAHRQ
jgi:hypothetical protein